MDSIRCVDCGRDFDAPAPECSLERCQDCAPTRGAGSHAAARFGSNLRRLRHEAGVRQGALAKRAGVHYTHVSLIERGRREAGVALALQLVEALDAPFDRLFEGIYWNPGEVAPIPKRRRPRSLRLAGFLLVSPWGFEVDVDTPGLEIIGTRLDAAAILGRHLREARERRHLSQCALAAACGIGRGGLSKIEGGHRETTLRAVLALSRALEVAPDVLIGGMEWASALRDSTVKRPAANRGWPDPSADALGAEEGTEISVAEVAIAIGEEITRLRHAAGLTLAQLGEGIESGRERVHHVEKGRCGVPRVGTLMRIAASLNVQPSRLTAGVRWDSGRRVFRRQSTEQAPPLVILGRNVRRVRRRLGLTQEDVAVVSGIDRAVIGGFELGLRNFRVSHAVRLISALGIDAREFFDGVVDWHIRPLPPPVGIDGAAEESISEADLARLLERFEHLLASGGVQ